MKSAFSMIELIISIVVMSLVAVTVPVIVLATTRANEVNLRQEAIMSAKTRISSIMRLNWHHSMRAPNDQPDCQRVQGMYPILKLSDIGSRPSISADLLAQARKTNMETFFQNPRCVDTTTNSEATVSNQTPKIHISQFRDHQDNEIIDVASRGSNTSKNILNLQAQVKIMHTPDTKNGTHGGIIAGDYRTSKEITYAFNGAGGHDGRRFTGYHGTLSNGFAIIMHITPNGKHSDMITMRGFAFNIGDRPRLNYRVIN